MCAGLLQIGASGTDTQTPGSYRDHDRSSLGVQEPPTRRSVPQHAVGAMGQHLMRAARQVPGETERCESLCLLGSLPHRLLGRASRSGCVVSRICFARRCRWSRLAGSSQVSCATTTPANGAGREARILKMNRGRAGAAPAVEKTFVHLFTQSGGDNTPPAPSQHSDRHDLQHHIMSWPPTANEPPASRGHSSAACMTLQPAQMPHGECRAE
jgi:hypothetical protein